MKISLPESQSDITLEQYQKYTKLLERDDLDDYSFNRRKLMIFTSLSYEETGKITQVDFESCLAQIDKGIKQEAKFENRFNMLGTEFGFIPNLDKITTAEYIDLSKYADDSETLQNLMAVLYRPITKKDPFGNYEIAEYDGTKEYAEVMKQTPLNIVNGALFFFINLSQELVNYTQKYTEEELKRVNKLSDILLNGDGLPQSMN